MMYKKLYTSLGLPVLCVMLSCAGVLSSPNSTPVITSEDIIRVRASVDETQNTFVQWQGQALIYKPGDAPRIAFDVLGMNVARVKKLDDGSFDILARELQLYLDPTTGDILHSWTNPITNETVNVIHVQNSPVYQNIPAPASYRLRALPHDFSTFTINIPLAYPNPLNPRDDDASPFKPYQGDYQALYSAVESFTYTFADSELNDKTLNNVASTQIYWTRTSPLLPWMKSPNTNATLLFIANGAKVKEGWGGLQPVSREVLCNVLPAYREAPANRSSAGGGITSWSFFTQANIFSAWLNGTEFPIEEERL